MTKSAYKQEINKLHAIAEFQKKLAWSSKKAAECSQLFKSELEEVARQASASCRETRQAIRNLIDARDDRRLLELNADWD